MASNERSGGGRKRKLSAKMASFLEIKGPPRAQEKPEIVCDGANCDCKTVRPLLSANRPIQLLDQATGKVLDEYCCVSVAARHLGTTRHKISRDANFNARQPPVFGGASGKTTSRQHALVYKMPRNTEQPKTQNGEVTHDESGHISTKEPLSDFDSFASMMWFADREDERLHRVMPSDDGSSEDEESTQAFGKRRCHKKDRGEDTGREPAEATREADGWLVWYRGEAPPTLNGVWWPAKRNLKFPSETSWHQHPSDRSAAPRSVLVPGVRFAATPSSTLAGSAGEDGVAEGSAQSGRVLEGEALPAAPETHPPSAGSHLHGLQEGERVEALRSVARRQDKESWVPGLVVAVCADGTLDVAFDHGEFEAGAHAADFRPLVSKPTSRASSGTTNPQSLSVERPPLRKPLMSTPQIRAASPRVHAHMPSDDRQHELSTTAKAKKQRYLPKTTPRQVSHSASSKYLGVSWRKFSSRWEAAIKVDGKSQYLGTYKTEAAAAQAYNTRAALIGRPLNVITEPILEPLKKTKPQANPRARRQTAAAGSLP